MAAEWMVSLDQIALVVVDVIGLAVTAATSARWVVSSLRMVDLLPAP